MHTCPCFLVTLYCIVFDMNMAIIKVKCDIYLSIHLSFLMTISFFFYCFTKVSIHVSVSVTDSNDGWMDGTIIIIIKFTY